MREIVQSHHCCCNEIRSKCRRHLNKGQPVSAPRAQRFENKYGTDRESEERVNSSMEHMKSNEMEREEYNIGPPMGIKVPKVVPLLLSVDWMGSYICSPPKVGLIVWSSAVRLFKMLSLILVPF